ncbi:MAG: valine--tRNA ligase [Nitrospinota bacterium]
MLDTRYSPHRCEDKWYRSWLERNYFHAEVEGPGEPYSIVIPPPNVTGSLHMGHALNNTIQDILCRWKRMEGFRVLWMPGTDHAGIATQNVVEQELAREGTDRHELGREAFIQRVWEWKEKYGGIITGQLRRLGASCDWERERFTMDEGLSAAVREAFVRLWEEGLIYRGDYIINWCPRCLTALSDLEVEHEEIPGHLYYVRYPMRGEEGYVAVATTRPETILGDTAVAVNPGDERYRSLVGKRALLPLLERELPIIADSYVDPEFGTGALKITPAHDPNDFEVGLRHGLPQLNVLDPSGRMNEAAGPYQGLERFEARRRVIEDLKVKGLLLRVENYNHKVGHCYRCRTVVEPYLSKQWFVRTKSLAEPAIEAVKEGRIKIIPESWESTYFEWMYNIRDWCISRQLWWGHRIPAWFCKECDAITVARETPSSCSGCGGEELRQETDVLDTWFSSALWPFSTFGWPEMTPELKVFYPTSVLVTGFDILFFWVARMIMMGLKFMGDVPFREVYIHALIRDEEGEKMSKTRGNVIDPLDVMERFGADSLRFTLTALAAQGRDIRLSEKRIRGYSRFCQKVWNACRLALMHMEELEWHPDLAAGFAHGLRRGDRWILSRTSAVSAAVRESLSRYAFDAAAGAIYHFIWHELCDWYLEIVKPRLREDNPLPSDRLAAQATLAQVLDVSLCLLHPFMPFLTEELWQMLPNRDGESISLRPFPRPRAEWRDDEVEAEMSVPMRILDGIRNIRGELGVAPSTLTEAYLRVPSATLQDLLKEEIEWVRRLGKVGRLEMGPQVKRPKGAAAAVAGEVEVFIPVDGLVDLSQEKRRLEKQLGELERELRLLKGKLSNPSFLERAPKGVVEKDRGRLSELEGRAGKLRASLKALP